MAEYTVTLSNEEQHIVEAENKDYVGVPYHSSSKDQHTVFRLLDSNENAVFEALLMRVESVRVDHD